VSFTVAHLTRPREGERENGDAILVRELNGRTLIAVIDALGHGPMAAIASRAAVEQLAKAPLDQGIRRVVEGVHDQLRGTRGAAAMVCIVHEARLEGCGIGNVELRSLGSKVPTVLSPGILGAFINRIRTFEAQVVPGDRLVIFSDGLSSRIDFSIIKGQPPEAACRTLMDRHRRPHDDSTVLVADFEAERR